MLIKEIKEKIQKMYKEYENQNTILSMIDKLYRDNKIDTVDRIELYNFYTAMKNWNSKMIKWIK